MLNFKVLVVDDEKLIRWSFEKYLMKKGCRAFSAGTGEECIKIIETVRPDVIFLDNKLPDTTGLELLKNKITTGSDTFVIFMTAHGSIETAVEAMKNGAFDYLNKPFNFQEIDLIFENIQRQKDISNEIQLLKRSTTCDSDVSHFVAKSPKTRQVLAFVKKLARSQAGSMLLLGESGTGKDLLARVFHSESDRRDKPFVVINCSLLSKNLLESELFGHEKGAFTDARQMKKGLFEVANKGTVFLDEIGEIDLATQVKLLQFIENKTYRRVGGTEDLSVDVKIIAATNRDIEKAVAEKTFREDLYYRLKIFQVDLPPLRERPEDIPAIIDYYLQVFNKQFGKKIKGVTPKAMKILNTYSWPGNVRELKNILERAVILEDTPYLDVDCFPLRPLNKNASSTTVERIASIVVENQIPFNTLEKEVISAALEAAGKNKTAAARLLSISRDVLRSKINRHKITVG